MRNEFSTLCALIAALLLAGAVMGRPFREGEIEDDQHDHEDTVTEAISRSHSLSASVSEFMGLHEQQIKCRVCIAAIDTAWKKGESLREQCRANHSLRLRLQHDLPDDGEDDENGQQGSKTAGGDESAFDAVEAKRNGVRIEDEDLDDDSDDEDTKDGPADRRSERVRTARGPEEDICDGDTVKRSVVAELVNNICADILVTHRSEPHGDTYRLRTPHIDNEATTPDDHPDDKRTIHRVCRKWLHKRHSAEKITNHLYATLRNNRVYHKIVPALRKGFCFKACNIGRRRGPTFQMNWKDEL